MKLPKLKVQKPNLGINKKILLILGASVLLVAIVTFIYFKNDSNNNKKLIDGCADRLNNSKQLFEEKKYKESYDSLRKQESCKDLQQKNISAELSSSALKTSIDYSAHLAKSAALSDNKEEAENSARETLDKVRESSKNGYEFDQSELSIVIQMSDIESGYYKRDSERKSQ